MVVLFTNGLKIRERMIADICALWPHGVEISIYSDIPEKHDAITGVKGSFARSLLTLDKFRQAGIRTTFKTTLMKSTAPDYARTRALGEQHADTVILTTMMAPGVDGKKAPLGQALSFGQLVGLAATPDSPLYVGNALDGWRKAGIGNKRMKPCGAGHASLAVTPEGNILPCLAFPMRLGNVRQTSLSALLQHAPAKHPSAITIQELAPADRLAAWQRIRLGDLRECGTHDRCEWCGDICPGDAYVQTGDPLASAENHCREAYARMTAANELESGLNRTAIYTKYGVDTDFGGSVANIEQPIKWHSARNAVTTLSTEELSS
jgi:radical SAM protein with 4Fe4S-binding SPASM domain